MNHFFREILRRNVHRVAIAYLAGSWLIVQVLETVFPLYGFDDSGIRTIILALLVGFFPVLGLSWAFEWSAGGVRSQADIDQETTAPRTGGRTTDRIIIGVLSIAVMFFAADKFLLDTPPVPVNENENSIAVLPFDDMTSAKDQAFFADGLAEELLNILAQNRSLKVTARTSSFSFRNAALPVGEIARQLGVKHILEGSVRRDGDRVRVTAQLISAEDGFHVWSETYEEPLSGIFEIQDRISSQIAAALEVTVLDGKPRSETIDPEAYTLFLQANYTGRQGSASSMLEATHLYLQALEISPDYAPAWSNLSSVYINLVSAGELSADYAYVKARDAASKSVSINPQHVHGYDQLAWIAFWYEANIEVALANMQTALDLEPGDAETIGSAAVLVMALGRADEAVKFHEYSTARSPVDPVAIHNLALAYKYADRLQDAERYFRKLVQLSPEYEGGHYQLGESLLLMGRTSDALNVWEDEPDDAYRLKGLALGHYSAGNVVLADEALSELVQNWGEQWPSEIAHVYAWRGELNSAFDWLEKEYAKYGAGGWGEWKLQRLYDNLRHDPRWNNFLVRAGVSEEQLSVYDLDLEVSTDL